MLGYGGGSGVSRAPAPPGEHCPKPYAIMRSDSSVIRLFFFWTR